MTNRICIIGAGPSGVSAMYNFAKLGEAGTNIPEIVCYEKQSDWLGLWNYTWRTGTDVNGEPCHNSMYKYLWSNAPKEALEFPDYTFEQHFGKITSSFPPRTALRDYLEGRFSQERNLKQWIKFNHAVKRVVYNKDSDSFLVDVMDYDNDNFKTSQEFSHVLVCVGHFSTPYVPDTFPGIETFPGTNMHAHDVRDMKDFKDKRVLIVGSSYSAEDIALQAWKYGAKHVVISWRSKPMGFKWPKGIEEKPLLTNIESSKVTFKDGTSSELDVIVLCTGYKHYYPFLANDLRLESDAPNSYYPVNMYKGVLWVKGGNNKLFYLGAQDQCYTFTMFDIQALWAVNVILGLHKIPNMEEMKRDIDEWLDKLSKLKDAFDCIGFQTDYLVDLCKVLRYPHSLDASKQFHYWENHKREDILTYRDRCFKSLFTGNMSVPNKKTFVEAYDDSLEDYIS